VEEASINHQDYAELPNVPKPRFPYSTRHLEITESLLGINQRSA
jgi:hypothetical protein